MSKTLTSAAAAAAKAPGAPLGHVARLLVLSIGGSAALVVTVGWLTDLREWMHASLLAFCVVAFLPFIVVGALLALLLLFVFALALIAAATGADDAELPPGFSAHAADGLWGLGGALSRPYYGWLARHRRSPVVGVPLGVLLGGLILWGLLGLLVVPREAETTERLLAGQAHVEGLYRKDHRYPGPDASGHLRIPEAALEAFSSSARSQQGQLLDGFGRPVLFDVKGHGRFASYRLRSLGFDGVRSGDDLCVEGQTRLQATLDLMANLSALVHITKLDRGNWPERLQRVRSASCVGDS